MEHSAEINPNVSYDSISYDNHTAIAQYCWIIEELQLECSTSESMPHIYVCFDYCNLLARKFSLTVPGSIYEHPSRNSNGIYGNAGHVRSCKSFLSATSAPKKYRLRERPTFAHFGSQSQRYL